MGKASMNRSENGTNATTIFFMFISAGVFAYFGFAGSWAHQYTTTNPPELLTMVVLLKWTLRAGAIAFGVAAVLSMLRSGAGPLLYCVVGLITAVLFVVVGIWEMTNPQGYFSGIPAILLFLFAAWNGFGSWTELQEMFGGRKAPTVGGTLHVPPGPPAT